MPRPLSLLLLAFLLAVSPPALAQEPESAEVLAARREFVQGAELVKQERWAEALAAFERAAAQKAHAITTFNVAQCERALGQYTRARRSLVRALEQDASDHQLPESARVEARGMLAEIERILSRVSVTLKPEDAAIAIDGRPLERVDGAVEEGVPALVAGTETPGPGRPAGTGKFRVLLNPGTHVLTFSQRGYQDVVINKSLSPGSITPLNLELDKLPATIHVTSSHADAIVKIDGADVGNPPVEVSRAAGRYRVVVTRSGFLPYETQTTVRPGEYVELAATLREDRPALTQRWWFWTAAGALVIGAATTTYFLTRSDPEPTRPPPSGGGLGWSLKVPQ